MSFMTQSQQRDTVTSQNHIITLSLFIVERDYTRACVLEGKDHWGHLGDSAYNKEVLDLEVLNQGSNLANAYVILIITQCLREVEVKSYKYPELEGGWKPSCPSLLHCFNKVHLRMFQKAIYHCNNLLLLQIMPTFKILFYCSRNKLEKSYHCAQRTCAKNCIPSD